MNRRGFLKNFGIGTAAVAVPTTVLSQTSDEFDIDKWEDDITKEIQVFSQLTDFAYESADKTILPVLEYYSITNQLGNITKYCRDEEHLPLCDNIIDKLFTSLIKYSVVNGDSTRATTFAQQWFWFYQKVGDEFMRKTQEECEYIIDTKFAIQKEYWQRNS